MSKAGGWEVDSGGAWRPISRVSRIQPHAELMKALGT